MSLDTMKCIGIQKRCAIYTRKSTTSGLALEINSLETQREVCSAYIKSQAHKDWVEIAQRYDDGGFSGGSLERPALKRLISDIEAGRVDLIVVYKIDRLGRSLIDFVRLISILDKYGTSFVSVTQTFDTSDSMGRLVLNTLLTFAQFERELASDRTRDKKAALMRRGLFVGGTPPFGYLLAILALDNPANNDFVLRADELDELHPLMAVPQDWAVTREAAFLADAMKGLLQFSSHILFVDPFFDPYNNRYKSTLRDCLRIVSDSSTEATCEIHYRYHPAKPDNTKLEGEAVKLFKGIIPDGMQLSIFCWKQRNGGADFHARYLLTERGGIGIDAGFSAEGADQTTDMHLMSYELSQVRLKSFARAATEYELAEPVLRISAKGAIEHI